jgi:hypothetical protein
MNQITAADELIEGNTFKHSKQEAQSLRRELRTMSMSSNLQGETIPMAYSKYFLDGRNITNNLTMNTNINNSSSNNINLGKNLQEKKEWFKSPTEAEPIVINQVKKQKVKKKHRCENKSYPIKTKKKYIQEEKPNHSSNQYILSEVVSFHSNQVAPPIEVSLTEVMSNIIRGETILMAWAVLSHHRGIFQVVYQVNFRSS